MKGILKKSLTVAIAAAVVLMAGLLLSANTYAQSGSVLPDGASITAGDVNVPEALNAVYTTDTVSNDSRKFNYSLNIPESGTLLISRKASASDVKCYVDVQGTGIKSAGSSSTDGVDYDYFYVSGAGTAALSVSVSALGTSGFAAFSAAYAPAGRSFEADGQDHFLGAASSDAESTISVNVPSKGYLEITAQNDANPNYSFRIMTKGFKGWQGIGSSYGNTTYIGVKAGTYTISLRDAKLYSVKMSFHKVKETSAKTSKGKAAKIKKNKANKGLIITDSRKVHWYKIKNPKRQKMKLAVNASCMSRGNSYSDLKVTVVFPDKSKRSATVTPGSSNTFSITFDKIGSKKAKKGTYYVKVESKGGANGYYTLKWK